MAVDIYGNIITEQGQKTGGAVNVQTGQVVQPNTISPITTETLNQGNSIINPPTYSYPDFSTPTNAAIAGAQTSFNEPRPEDTTLQTTNALLAQLGITSDLTVPPTSGTDYFTQLTGLTPEQIATNRAESQRKVRDLNAQMASLKSEADQLKLREQAIPLEQQEVGIGRRGMAGIQGLTEQELRKNALKSLDLAYRTLPVSAQLNAEQGNLDAANANITTLLGLQEKDQQATKEYNDKWYERMSKVADTEQKNRIEIWKDKRNIEDAAKTELLDWKKQYVKSAIDNGNYKLAGQLATAKTLEELQSLSQQIQPKQENLIYRELPDGRAVMMDNQGNIVRTVATKIGGINGAGMIEEDTTNQLKLATAKSNIDLISGLTTDSYLTTAVGPNRLARISFTNVFTGGKDNFIAGVEQLRSQLSLDSLINAKKQGATFGALSDTEMKILSASASKLGTWAIKDEKDPTKIIGYQANEKDFKKELEKINNFARLDYILKGGDPIDVGAQQMGDGTIWVLNNDGTYTQLK